ncbi:MAG TPA: hypothetical protein VMW48_03565, partial [Vicinamibacterales bacterium]|nr:hypothetical protein [Vicinamibacterales bacterium]
MRPFMLRSGLALVVFTVTCRIALAGETIDYPRTKARPVTETMHGVEVTDNYRWLEDGESWVVRLWDRRQNKLTRERLDGFPVRDQIAQRLEEYYVKPREWPPRIRGGRTFVWRGDGLADYA